MSKIKTVSPGEIEKKSFEIITGLLGEKSFPPLYGPIIKRVIHTTADLDYADLVKISDGAVEAAAKAIREGFDIVTDTRMAEAGVSKKTLARYGGRVVCFIDDVAVAEEAKIRNVTRSLVSMEKAAGDAKNGIFAIGNAPTALIRLSELIEEGKARPQCVVGVPVGFVNVVEAKRLLESAGVPFIVTEGRKGGSTVAAAIINAVLYLMRDGLV